SSSWRWARARPHARRSSMRERRAPAGWCTARSTRGWIRYAADSGGTMNGQTVVVIGGSAGIGLETARRARAEGANVILTGRDPGRLQRAASELGALRSVGFDAS